MSEIILIAAVAENDVIGDAGNIPWMGKMKADLRRFRELTMGKPVIMGRKTYESLGKALPGRKNLVFTRDSKYYLQDAFVVHDIERAHALTRQSEKIFVIGGAEIYRLFLPYAHRIELTRIHETFEGAVRFPEIPQHHGNPVTIESHKKDAENAFDYDFVTYTLFPASDGSLGVSW